MEISARQNKRPPKKKRKKKLVLTGLTFVEKKTHHNIQVRKAHGFCHAVPYPPARKWPLIIELLLTLSITNDTLSTVMNTFCWGPIWLTGQWWRWPFGPPSTTCWFLPREWKRRQTGQSTPSSEHSVVMSTEGKTTLCLKQSFVDSSSHTVLYVPHHRAASVFNSSENIASWQSVTVFRLSNTELRHIFSKFLVGADK